MKDEPRPPGEAMERFTRAMQRIITVSKEELDKRAKTWMKRRRIRKR